MQHPAISGQRSALNYQHRAVLLTADRCLLTAPFARGTNAAARAAIGNPEPTPSAPVAAPLSSTLGTKPQP